MDVKTTAEADAATLTGAELIRAVQAGGNVKLTPAQLRAYVRLMQIPRFSGATWNRLFCSQVASDNAQTSQPSGINTLRAGTWRGGLPQLYNLIQTEVVTPVASSLFRMGLYKADPITGYPTSLVYGTAALSGATAQVVSEAIAPSILLDETMYWVALFADSNISFRAISTAGAYYEPMGENAAMGGTLRQSFLTIAQTFGPMPANFPAGATINATSSFMSKIGLMPV